MLTLYNLQNDEIVCDQLWEKPSSVLLKLSNNSTEYAQIVLITGGQFIENEYLSNTIQLSYNSQSVKAPFYRERIQIYNDDAIIPKYVHVTFFSGEIANEPPFTEYITPLTVAFYTGSIFETIVTSSFNDTGSINVAFYTGSIFDTIITSSVGDIGINITNVTFYTGSIFDIIIQSNNNGDTGSVTTTFYTGSIFNEAIISSGSDSGLNTLNISFLSGYIS